LLAQVIAATARIAVTTALDGTLGREHAAERADKRLAAWSARMLRIADVHLETEGQHNLGQGETFVVMSNHQSHFDVPVIYHSITRRLRMVGKTELFKIPVFGRAMRVAGFIEVDRGNRNQAVRALDGARAALASGTNIWIAPEGTRSETGRLNPFKKGGFHLAVGSAARILPVSIDGTKDVLAAHSRDIRPGQSVRVVIGKPIDTKSFGKERMSDLMDAVRAAIAQHIPYA
jgi:1-acyl-sn-glycerol-3-phosphate acyltransferase